MAKAVAVEWVQSRKGRQSWRATIGDVWLTVTPNRAGPKVGKPPRRPIVNYIWHATYAGADLRGAIFGADALEASQARALAAAAEVQRAGDILAAFTRSIR